MTGLGIGLCTAPFEKSSSESTAKEKIMLGLAKLRNEEGLSDYG